MQTVLITGVSKGIGKALAQKFLAEGYFVIGTSLDGTLDYTHSNLVVYQLDLSAHESISQCVDVVGKVEKNIDILINNAGCLFDEDETTVVVEKLRKTLEVNLIGTVNLTEQILPLLHKKEGHVVFMSSTAGSLADTGHISHYPGHYPSYKISKAALNMYMRTLSVRLKDKLTVSSVHPGWVQTDMGGPEADLTPEQAAESVFILATSRPETGQFWFNGEKLPW